MSALLVDAASVAPQPWRNGGGQTRELLTWPAAGDWMLRISRADIDADGPFSAFPGVERWFCVLRGNGVALGFPDAQRQLRVGDGPLRFAGQAAPSCRLLGGATQDLNLMARHGQASMRLWQPGQAWDEAFAMRGLYTTRAGRWSDGMGSRSVGADSLLWWHEAVPTAWTFTPADPAGGPVCWLGYTPHKVVRR